jgi:hypothetical protein
LCNLLKVSFHCFLCAIKSDNFVSKFILSENFLVKITIIQGVVVLLPACSKNLR